MALPKIQMPLYEDKLPSNGMEILYRPYTVKEEKILLIAKQSKNFEQAILSAKQILNNCVRAKKEKDVFDVETLPIFDIEYLLLRIRSRSVDNEIEFKIKDDETDETVTLKLNLENIEVKTYPNHSNKIKLNDDYMLVMRYPTINAIMEVDKSDLPEVERSYNILVSCLDKLVSTETTYDFTNETNESIGDFLDDLDPKAVAAMNEFFQTTPRIRHEIKYTNNLGKEKSFVIEGTETFFI